MSREEKPKPYINRLVVKADKSGPSGYEIEFEFPYGTSTNEFEDARQNGLEAIRKWLDEKPDVPVSEVLFNGLRWEANNGPKLGDFETAYKTHNQLDPWQQAWNTLKVNNATLKDHYDPEDFVYFYWIYPDKYTDRIFRKRRQRETPK